MRLRTKATRWLGVVVSLSLLHGGCGSPQAETQPTQNDGSTPTTVEGPGFRLTVPAEFVLTDDQPVDSRTSYWRWFDDSYGSISVAIGVVKSSSGTTTAQGPGTSRIVGATITSNSDFLVLMMLKLEDSEIKAAYATLASGDVLMVMVGGPTYTTATDGVAGSVFSTIDLDDTDGRQFAANIIQNSPVLTVKADNGMWVLSDDSVWKLLPSATATDTRTANTWALGDPIYPQSHTEGYITNEELVDLYTWQPVQFDFVGQGSRSTISEINPDSTLVLASGLTVKLSGSIPASWAAGDIVVLIEEEFGSKWLINLRTGNAVSQRYV